jgi:RNA polymerase sigma factor (sigma-70 family)
VGVLNVPEPDAEELTQDVLFRVHSRVSAFRNDGRTKLTTWIFEIAKNHAIDHHRVFRARQQELTESDRTDSWDGEYAGRNRAYLAWLKLELAKFSEEDRRILIWRAQDFSYAEIGRWLCISEGAARVRYCRAKERLAVAGSQVEMLGVVTERDTQE